MFGHDPGLRPCPGWGQDRAPAGRRFHCPAPALLGDGTF